MSELECPVFTQARNNPGGAALEQEKVRLCYAELDALIRMAQRLFIAAGVRSSQRVAIVARNSWRYVVLLQALFRLRAVAVPTSTRFPESMATRLLHNLKCDFVVSDGSRTMAFDRCLAMDDLVPFSKMTDRETADPAPYIALEQPATILFSSGSTGLPKAVLHSWENHYYSALGSNENIVLGPSDRWLLSLPLYHVAGIAVLFRCFVAGAAVVVPAPGKAVEQALRDEGITHVSMVDTQLVRLLDTAAGRPFPALKSILLGGSAISSGLIVLARGLGLPIHTSYGLTEMASQVTTTPAGAAIEDLQSSGKLLRYREIKRDDVGQILVRGKTRFIGYIDETGMQFPFDRDGWFPTGDLGRFDERKCLHVLGRKDNMFVSGGENIHPEEIERALERIEGVARAFVVSVPDEEYGRRPVAFVEAGGMTLDKGVLDRKLAKSIARFMLPLAYFDLSKFDETAGIKTSRKALEELARQQLGK